MSFNGLVHRLVLAVAPWYLRTFEGVKKVTIDQPQRLTKLIDQATKDNRRLIIAFRHAAKEDAPVLMHAFNSLGTHPAFLYGSDVPQWAGKKAEWIFPRLGAIAVQNLGANSSSMQSMRRTLAQGKFPLALAPEAQVTYHMYRTKEITGGVASLALWATEQDLVPTILPVVVGYRHSSDQIALINSLLQQLQQKCSFSLTGSSLSEQLLEATTALITLLSSTYDVPSNPELSLEQNIHILCEVLLAKGEELFDYSLEGSLLTRLFTLRYKILKEGEKGSSDTTAASIYQQIVDSLMYVDPSYITPPCSNGRGCEYALHLLDLFNRMQGGNINSRYSPKNKEALVVSGEPIVVGPRTQSRKNEAAGLTKIVEGGLEAVSKHLESIWEHTQMH